MDYQLKFVIREEKKDLLIAFLRYFCILGGLVGIAISFLVKIIFDIILDKLFYLCFGCVFITRILINMMEIKFKKDVGTIALCTDGSILFNTNQKEWSLDKIEIHEIVIYFHHSYNGSGTGWYDRKIILIGDDNTIKITSKEGKVFNYFFLSEYKEDLSYLNELVSYWKSIDINVVFTTNEKYKNQ